MTRAPDQCSVEPDDSSEPSPVLSQALHSGDVFGMGDALSELKRSSVVIKPEISEEIPLPSPLDLSSMRCYQVFEGDKTQ